MAKTSFEPPFLLIRQNGEVTEYSNLEALAAACRAARIHIHDQHVCWGWIAAERLSGPTPHEWIARDLRGRVIRQSDLDDLRSHPRFWYPRDEMRAKAAALGLPIPYVGKHRRGRPNYHRRPRHMSLYREAAISEVVERDERMVVEGRIYRPPNAWDDLMAGDRKRRTWKQSRKTRWRKDAVSYRRLNGTE